MEREPIRFRKTKHTNFCFQNIHLAVNSCVDSFATSFIGYVWIANFPFSKYPSGSEFIRGFIATPFIGYAWVTKCTKCSSNNFHSSFHSMWISREDFRRNFSFLPFNEFSRRPWDQILPSVLCCSNGEYVHCFHTLISGTPWERMSVLFHSSTAIPEFSYELPPSKKQCTIFLYFFFK